MKRFVIFLLSLSLFVTMPARVYAEEEEKESTQTVKSSILMCLNTGEVLSENNSHERLSPASVTKIMSLLIVFESIDSGRISLDDMVTADETAVSKGGSQIWLEVGEQMSVNDLLKAVIIASANDACTLLGEYVAGSESLFTDMMNKRAAELGLEDTHFENCTGLDDSTTNHYSSAYDLAIISRELMKYDLITEYSTVWLDSLRNGKTELNNTNKLVNTYDGITGLKTGTTSNAGFCVSATATREGLSFVAVVLGASTSEERFSLAASLLDEGFANYKLEKLNIDSEMLAPVKVKNGVIKSITPTLDSEQDIIVKKELSEFEYEYNIKEQIEAPVKEGDVLGEIVVKSGEEEVTKITLYAQSNVEKINFKYIFTLLFENI